MFILELTPEDKKKERAVEFLTKRNAVKTQWISKYYNNTSYDDIIFGSDPDIHVKSQTGSCVEFGKIDQELMGRLLKMQARFEKLGIGHLNKVPKANVTPAVLSALKQTKIDKNGKLIRGNAVRQQMTNADWELRFEQLWDLELINFEEFCPDFFDETLYFKDPDALKIINYEGHL